MRRVPNGKGLRTVVVVCLAGLYFVLAIGVTLLGSSIYRATAADAKDNSDRRTALSYVANQIRRNEAQAVVLGEFEGVPALRLTELGEDGTAYATYLYCYDGWLMELYTEQDSGLLPADGTALLELKSLRFARNGKLLTFTAENFTGKSWSLTLCPREGIEEVGRL